MARRELLQLADTYNPKKHKIAGRYISDKLDGTRCFWDGGLTRGMRTEDVPYANLIDPKTGKRKTKIKPIATGLYSRYGNPIIAPDWFLNSLPCTFLDGELFAGEGNFQLCRSICGGDTPDPRFDQIKYAVYGAPPVERLFMPGEIKNANFHLTIDEKTLDWVMKRVKEFGSDFVTCQAANFDEELMFLSHNIETQSDTCFLHRQVKLPGDEGAAIAAKESFLHGVLDKGGEGTIIRDGLFPWTPKRIPALLKDKPFEDAEATITGFTSGREGKQGNRLGRIGALITEYVGPKGKVRLELAGLNEKETELPEESQAWAIKNPGQDMPGWATSKVFRVGQTVTFKYRELSDDQIPKEARYWRKRDVE